MSDGSRRDALADAAITVLARAGGRGLTHRAVDRAAGLAEGSTSYYFRTRESLLSAVVERLAVLDAASLPQMAGSGRRGLTEDFATVVEELSTAGRDRLLARYELSLEATRRPELRQTLRASATAVRAAVAERLSAAGVDHAQRTAEELLLLLDGLLLEQVTGLGARHLDRPALRERIDRLLTAAGV